MKRLWPLAAQWISSRSIAFAGWLIVGWIALWNSTEGWAIVIQSITAISMLYALLAWAVGRGRRRVFCSGMAIVGCGYLTILFIHGKALEDDLISTKCLEALFRRFNPDVELFYPDPGTGESLFNFQRSFPGVISVVPVVGSSDRQDEQDRPKLVTDTETISLGQWPTYLAQATASIPPEQAARTAAYLVVHDRLTKFPRIGHCLFALLFGAIGGWTACRIAEAPQREFPTVVCLP